MSGAFLLDKPVLHIKTGGRGKVEKDFFIDDCWMEQANNIKDIKIFLDDIYHGVDKNQQIREMVRQRDIPLADGKSGQRVCDSVWELLHREEILT